MNDKQWNAWLADVQLRLKRRLAALEAVKRGDAQLKRVEVRSYKVRAYTVRKHVRYIAPATKVKIK